MLAATLRRGPLGLIDALRESRVPRDAQVLLLVDQFEELFRFRERAHDKPAVTEAQRNEAAAFVELLLQTARQADRPVYVVITMRSDFLGDCDAFLGLPEAINDGQFLAPRLTREQLAEVIRRPAELFGARIDEALVNRLLNELGNDPDQLPVLQHALMRMWTQKHAVEVDTTGPYLFTVDDYALTGGLQNALSLHADEAYHSLDAMGQRIAERMFRCLSDGGTDSRLTRRLATIQEIADVAQVSVDQVITVAEAFRRPDRCFLTPPAGVALTAQSTLDISHESLLRLWSRVAEWVRTETTSRENFNDLRRRAESLEAGGDLLGRQDLSRFHSWYDGDRPTSAWAARYAGGLESVVELLEKSAEAIARDDERKQHDANVKRQMTVASFCVLTAFAAIVTILGLMAHRASDRATKMDWDGRFLYANSESERSRYARSAALHMWLYEKLARDDTRRDALLKFIGSESIRLGNSIVHDAEVQFAEFSPDGELLLTAAREAGEARTWLVASGEPVSEPMRHDGSITDATFSPDGRLVATASDDDTAKVWDSRTGKAIAALVHPANLTQLAFSPSGSELATTCADGKFRIWNPLTGQMVGQPVDHRGTGWTIRAHPAGGLFAIACADGKVRLVDVSSAARATRELPHASDPYRMAFSPDGRVLAVGCFDGTVVAWDVGSGRQLWDRPARHDTIVGTIAFSSDGTLIATGGNDTTARVWETRTGQPVGEVMKHGGSVSSVSFLKADGVLLTGSYDNAIRLWDFRTGRLLATPLRHQGPVFTVAVGRDHRLIASASLDYTARIWKLDGQLMDQTALPCHEIPRHAAFSPSGLSLVSSHNDGEAIVWDAKTWEVKARIPHEDFVNRAVFGLDDRTVVTACRDQEIRLWDVGRTVTLKNKLALHSWPSSMEASQDHHAAIIGTGHGDVFRLTLDSFDLRPVPKQHKAGVYGVSWSPRGSLFATTGRDERLAFWNARTIEPIAEPAGLGVGAFAAAFSPGGSLLAVGCDDGTVQLWEPYSRTRLDGFLAHEGYISLTHFNAQGDTLVTGSMDRSVRFWDTDSRLPCGVPLRHEGEVSMVLFASGGRKLLTTAFDKTMRLWYLGPPAIDDRQHPGRLRLSVEVRTGYRVDADGNLVRLEQAEWLELQARLLAMGGPCDAPTWDAYEAWRDQHPNQDR
jgi:WD40 repeat protein